MRWNWFYLIRIHFEDKEVIIYPNSVTTVICLCLHIYVTVSATMTSIGSTGSRCRLGTTQQRHWAT